MPNSVSIGPEPRVIAQILSVHSGQQVVPMFLDRDVDHDMTVISRVDVERRALTAAIAGFAAERCPTTKTCRDKR